MASQGYIAIIFYLTLFLTGCSSVTSMVLDQLQPSSEATVVAVATESDDQTDAPVVAPTPVGGGGSAPLLFVSNRNPDRTTDIYRINPDGSGLARLTHDPAAESDPRWSLDQRRIAFVSDRSGLNQIYLMSMTDYQITQLTDHPTGLTGPTWSPDNSQLAVVEANPATNAILVIDTESGEEVGRYRVDVQDPANPAWSPQGQVIIFSALVDDQGETRDIFSLNLGNERLINLTNQPGNDDRPAWSPSGERIAFQSDRDGDLNIYLMQANGALQTPLTLTTTAEVEPHWSADGALIAFSSDRDGPFHLYVMNENGAEAQVLAPIEADDRQPRWPPRVRSVVDQISYAGSNSASGRDLFIIAVSGAQGTQLTQTEIDDTTPAWSPDGSQLVFSSNRTGNYELYILDVEGSGELRQLTSSEELELHPAWSPDGTQIAFERKSEGVDWDVWLINSDGSNQRNLTNIPNSNDGNPDWSPDGQQLVFSSDRAGTFDLYLQPADGSENASLLTQGLGNEVHPSWSPDGKTIVFRAESESSGKHQLFTTTPDGLSVEPLFISQFNDDLPVWSPGSQQVAFASDRASLNSDARNRTYAIYVYDLRTARLERITQGTRDARYPAWRPRSAGGTR